jgi:hypothetical protein
MLIHQLKTQIPMEIPVVHWFQWTNKIPMDIRKSIGSIGYNGQFVWLSQWPCISTWRPWVCHYVIQIHGNSPTKNANVRWKFHLSIGSNGQTKFQWTFASPLDPLDPMDNSFGYLNGLVYLHDVHELVITSLKYMLIHQLKTQIPMEIPVVHWIQWTSGSIGSMSLTPRQKFVITQKKEKFRNSNLSLIPFRTKVVYGKNIKEI